MRKNIYRGKVVKIGKEKENEEIEQIKKLLNNFGKKLEKLGCKYILGCEKNEHIVYNRHGVDYKILGMIEAYKIDILKGLSYKVEGRK